MICQALIRASALTLLAGMLPACQTAPELEHRAVNSRLRSRLEGNMRPLTKDELKNESVHVQAHITFGQPVDVPMSQPGGMPHVPAQLNGSAPLPFLIDTGSQVCVLEARTAVAHRVTMLDKSYASPSVVGTTGDEPALVGTPHECAIGSWSLEGFPFVVRTHETKLRVSWWERKNLGRDVIGMNVILRSCNYLTFDFPAERVIIGSGERFSPPSGKGVWKAPLIIRDGRPFVQLQTNHRQWTALIDTGFNGLLDMDKSTAQRLQLLGKAKPAAVYRFGVGAPTPGAPSQYGAILLPQLDSLGPKLTNLPTIIVPERSQSKIGCALLRPFRVTLDFKRRYLWLEDTGREKSA